MTLTLYVSLILCGLLIGTVSGMVGIGGGILIIPLLMLAFGFSQERANGTSLAMLLPPIGIIAVLTYAKAGSVDWRVAGLLAIGFGIGALVGAKLVNYGLIHPTALRVCFALLLIYCASRMLFQNGGPARAALETTILFVAFAASYLGMRLLGRYLLRSKSRWGAEYRARLKRREPATLDFEI